MTRKLSEIEIDEVSLVDRPANKGARVLLHKRKGNMTIDELRKATEAGEYKTVEDVLEEFRRLREEEINRREEANRRAQWRDGTFINGARLPYPIISREIVEADIWMSPAGQRLYSLLGTLPSVPIEKQEPEATPDPRTNTEAYKKLGMRARELLEKRLVPTLEQGIVKAVHEKPELYLLHLSQLG